MYSTRSTFLQTAITQALTHEALKEKKNVKQVHSQCFGINYTVMLHRYNQSVGKENPELKDTMEPKPNVHQKHQKHPKR